MTSKDKENILKAAREKKKKNIRYKRVLTALETIWIKKTLPTRNTLPGKAVLQEGRNEGFPRQKCRNFVTTRSVSEEMLMGGSSLWGRGGVEITNVGTYASREPNSECSNRAVMCKPFLEPT